MFLKQLFLLVCGLSFGFLASAGVFTVLVSVGLIPRFAGKMHVARKMFVGCLAFAIAEMLNSIPIFARRIGFRHGLGVAICFAALGKLTGSLLYFAYGIFQTGM